MRALHERGALRTGDALPPVRELAAQLGVNRNTAVAAYRLLAQAGVVTARGRAGTVVAGLAAVAQEGYAADSVLRDIGTGNPDPGRIPDLTTALAGAIGRPVLYGEPVIDPALEERALAWVGDDLPDRPIRITVTNGAVDAVERLLAQALLRDDAVALEDPCFLASIHTVRLGGYRAVPVPVDAEGMTVDGLRAALDAGVRAIICTPRAQNPTGATLSPARAAAAARSARRSSVCARHRGRPLLDALAAPLRDAHRPGPPPLRPGPLGVEVPRAGHVPRRRRHRPGDRRAALLPAQPGHHLGEPHPAAPRARAAHRRGGAARGRRRRTPLRRAQRAPSPRG